MRTPTCLVPCDVSTALFFKGCLAADTVSPLNRPSQLVVKADFFKSETWKECVVFSLVHLDESKKNKYTNADDDNLRPVPQHCVEVQTC